MIPQLYEPAVQMIGFAFIGFIFASIPVLLSVAGAIVRESLS